MFMVKSATVDIGGKIYQSTKGGPQETKLWPELYNLATSKMID
jgi:hypothetical protein